MVVFPVIAAGISAVFSLLLFRQFSRRHRLPQLAWGVALAMYAVASVAVAAGVSGDWDPTLFRLYWLFGALLNVPWLALGSISLLGNRVLSVLSLIAVIVGTVWGIAQMGAAKINLEALSTPQIPKGRTVLCTPECQAAFDLARWYSFPAFGVVVAVALASARRRGGVRPPPERIRANWVIAVGVTIIAVGSTALARVGRGSAFSVTLALGVLVMFVGFVMASRPVRPAGGSPGEEPPAG